MCHYTISSIPLIIHGTFTPLKCFLGIPEEIWGLAELTVFAFTWSNNVLDVCQEMSLIVSSMQADGSYVSVKQYMNLILTTFTLMLKKTQLWVGLTP